MSRPTLYLGSRGGDVQQLQRLLSLSVDGHFGPATHAAVTAYQSRQGLAADGIVGPSTWAALEGALLETEAAPSWGAARAPFVLRLPSGWSITSGYGWRGTGEGRHFHAGIDLAGPAWQQGGPRLLAPCTGRIVSLKAPADRYGDGYGLCLEIEPDGDKEGVSLFVAHLDRLEVAQGQQVKEGAVLGVYGKTGLSYGIHAHIEVRHKGQHTDPAAHLRVEDLLVGQEAA